LDLTLIEIQYFRVYPFFLAEQDPSIKPTESSETKTTQENDIEMEDINNHCRAEGYIRFEVKNVSKVKDSVLSDPVTIRNLPWFVNFFSI